MKTMMLIATALISIASVPHQPADNISPGAWQGKSDDGDVLLIIEDGYYSFTSYDHQGKKFHYTYGGRVTDRDGALELNMEFHSAEPAKVGSTTKISYTQKGNSLSLDIQGKQFDLERMPEKETPLSGCWTINGRMQNGKMNIMQRRDRKTLKILSGSKFQWMAINPKTKEFSGTGGGSYTFENGKYTEHIEFFSRDSSRVGASLTFDGKVENETWHHSGQSSKGEPIHETWVKH